MQLLKIRGKKGEKLWENICGAGYMIKSQRRFLGGSVLIRSLRGVKRYLMRTCQVDFEMQY